MLWKLMCAAALAVTTNVWGQGAYPSKPVKLVVPFAAGGPTDVAARVVADKLKSRFNVPFVVENRPGAGGQISFEYVSRSAPDGYTLLIATASMGLLPLTNKSFKLDVLKDITPIVQFLSGPVAVTVTSKLDVNSMADLVAYAKANPGKLNYAAQGTSDLLAHELFRGGLDLDVVTVRYKGGAPAVQDVLSGTAHYTMASPGAVTALADAGKLRIVATTDLKRSPALPAVPTVHETVLPGFQFVFWIGLEGPPGLPKPIVDTIYEATRQAIQAPDVVARFRDLGYETTGAGPEELRKIIAVDLERARRAAAQLKLQPE